MFNELREKLATRPRRTLTRPKRAAVLVPIIDDARGPVRLLLTRRTELLPTHKGQVAFPGGRLEAGEGPTEASLREAMEEVALPPSAVEVLGLLDDLPTIHNDTTVTPVVGRVTSLPPLRPEPGEVARIFDIPLEVLVRRESWRVEVMERNGLSWPVCFCDYDSETLWGLSAYVVMNLLEQTPYGAPVKLPQDIR